MKTIGFCTHFARTDEWAFEYALKLARAQDWKLSICHWLDSPYNLRRDLVFDNFSHVGSAIDATPKLLVRLEQQLREYFEPKLGDFTQVGFKLCEGLYQVELVRCLRQHLLDMVVMGYQEPLDQTVSSEQPLLDFALHLKYPVVVVGPESPDQFLINQPAHDMLEQLHLPDGSWKIIEPASVVSA